MSTREGPGERQRPISVEIDIEDDRTMVSVTGETEAAVVVYSESGERIYLPPEDESDDDADPYSPVGADSPYEGDTGGQSPYGPGRQPADLGVNPTADGFLIRHPEPVEDVRLIR
jgi:hypothetical protein